MNSRPMTDPTPAALAALDAAFLEMVRDYAGALQRHPGTKRHEAMLNRVLEYVSELHASLDSLRTELRELNEKRAIEFRESSALLAAARQGQEDTARYRFLREYECTVQVADDECGTVTVQSQADFSVSGYGPTLDDATDAARAAVQPEEVSRGRE